MPGKQSRGGYLFTKPKPIVMDDKNPVLVGKALQVKNLTSLSVDSPTMFLCSLPTLPYEELRAFASHHGIAVPYDNGSLGGRLVKSALVTSIRAWHQAEALRREGYAESSDEEKEEPVKRKPGRPKKVQPTTIKKIKPKPAAPAADSDGEYDSLDDEDLIEQLSLLTAEQAAGNDAPQMQKRINALIPKLLRAGVITTEEAAEYKKQ